MPYLFHDEKIKELFGDLVQHLINNNIGNRPKCEKIALFLPQNNDDFYFLNGISSEQLMKKEKEILSTIDVFFSENKERIKSILTLEHIESEELHFVELFLSNIKITKYMLSDVIVEINEQIAQFLSNEFTQKDFLRFFDRMGFGYRLETERDDLQPCENEYLSFIPRSYSDEENRYKYMVTDKGREFIKKSLYIIYRMTYCHSAFGKNLYHFRTPDVSGDRIIGVVNLEWNPETKKPTGRWFLQPDDRLHIMIIGDDSEAKQNKLGFGNMCYAPRNRLYEKPLPSMVGYPDVDFYVGLDNVNRLGNNEYFGVAPIFRINEGTNSINVREGESIRWLLFSYEFGCYLGPFDSVDGIVSFDVKRSICIIPPFAVKKFNYTYAILLAPNIKFEIPFKKVETFKSNDFILPAIHQHLVRYLLANLEYGEEFDWNYYTNNDYSQRINRLGYAYTYMIRYALGYYDSARFLINKIGDGIQNKKGPYKILSIGSGQNQDYWGIRKAVDEFLDPGIRIAYTGVDLAQWDNDDEVLNESSFCFPFSKTDEEAGSSSLFGEDILHFLNVMTPGSFDYEFIVFPTSYKDISPIACDIMGRLKELIANPVWIISSYAAEYDETERKNEIRLSENQLKESGFEVLQIEKMSIAKDNNSKTAYDGIESLEDYIVWEKSVYGNEIRKRQNKKEQGTNCFRIMPSFSEESNVKWNVDFFKIQPLKEAFKQEKNSDHQCQ